MRLTVSNFRRVKMGRESRSFWPRPRRLNPAYTSLASNRISVLLAKSLEMGQPPLASAAALAKTSTEAPGTLALEDDLELVEGFQLGGGRHGELEGLGDGGDRIAPEIRLGGDVVEIARASCARR